VTQVASPQKVEGLNGGTVSAMGCSEDRSAAVVRFGGMSLLLCFRLKDLFYTIDSRSLIYVWGGAKAATSYLLFSNPLFWPQQVATLTPCYAVDVSCGIRNTIALVQGGGTSK